MRSLSLVIVLAACGPGGRAPGGGGGDDMPNPSNVDASAAAACPNVDLLFVIDDSGSMSDNQDSLIASFPGFVSGIKSRLASAQSYHIGVVTSDDYTYNGGNCWHIGDLVTRTGGPSSTNGICGPFAGGGPWMSEVDPDLSSSFACTAKVGAGGSSDERIARAIMNATDPARSMPGACNANFLRKDSLLVIVLITDEDDAPEGCDGSGTCFAYGSGGTPDEWYNTVVANRGGHANNIVVLSLFGKSANNACSAVPASELLEFTHNFGANGFTGDVCAASYDQFFLDALPVIDTACQKWEPVF